MIRLHCHVVTPIARSVAVCASSRPITTQPSDRMTLFINQGDTNSTVSRKYTEFAEVYPGWKVPRINEEIPIRQYILATYNKDIAKKYKLKPCSKIPSAYFRDLLTIREQLTRDTEG